MFNKINIREAEFNDLSNIIKLLSEDILGITREEYKEPLPQCYIDAFANITKDENNKFFVTCDNDGVIIGCFQITFTQYLSHRGSIRANIENVRVAKERRNLGIGTAMIQYAISIAKENNAKILQLTTDKSRTDAKLFYQKNGFIDTHEGMKLKL